MHKYLPSTYLVWNMTACGSATGLRTFSAVMPGSMTQSTCLLGLTLYQICVLPPPSQFSILIPHSIHLISYSWLHWSTFGPQQCWIRQPLWPYGIPPKWLWLRNHKCMLISVKGIVQTITWVNICGRINIYIVTYSNCMWTLDPFVLPFPTTACSFL